MAIVYFTKEGKDAQNDQMNELTLAELTKKLKKHGVQVQFFTQQPPKFNATAPSNPYSAYNRVVIQVTNADGVNATFQKPGFYQAPGLHPSQAQFILQKKGTV